VDSLWERHTWDFEFVVPKALGGQGEDEMEVDSNKQVDEEIPVIVVCTGELVEKLAHPHDSKRSIFIYSQSAPTSVQHVAFAVGPFSILTIPVDAPPIEPAPSDSAEISIASKTPMHVFCLPGLEAQLRAATSFYRTAMNFFTSEYGSYPFSSHKLVFVDEIPMQRFEASTLSLVTNDLLHGEDAIEQPFDTRHALSHALACQWVGINIIPKAWADIWLVNGLGLYITALFLRKSFGNNEYRYRLRKDMDRVYNLDTLGTMPPICTPNILEPPDGNVLSFIDLKSPLVLYILDRKLAKSGTALGLSRVLPKVFLSAISGELTNNTLSTHSFLRTCRKVSAVDVRTFSDQWIYGSGCPLFEFRANFNKKKMAVELYMSQVCPSYQRCEGDPVRMALLKPVPSFEVGSLHTHIIALHYHFRINSVNAF
jgi:transcription initiation factor TFIID subunit 2